MQLLNLSQNAFQRPIPNSLINLKSLTNLDLSSNSLSGLIPIVTLQKLQMLQRLNLSFNNLTGEVSKRGIFAKKNIVVSLIGNLSLCGPKSFQLPAFKTPRGHFALVKIILFPMSGAIYFMLCCLLLRFLWKGNMSMQDFDSSNSILQNLEHKRISYQGLQIETNGFFEASLLGVGNFGSVYKGILRDGTLVALKVFHLKKYMVENYFTK